VFASLFADLRLLRTADAFVGAALCGNSRPEASASSPSSYSTPRQSQIELRAVSSLGQPRPIGRGTLAGGLYRPWFPHIGTAASWTSRLALLAISGEAGGLPPFELLDKPLGQLWFA
jgi:hypothetical protein